MFRLILIKREDVLSTDIATRPMPFQIKSKKGSKSKIGYDMFLPSSKLIEPTKIKDSPFAKAPSYPTKPNFNTTKGKIQNFVI
jgi:hypothetical protein